MSKEENPDAVDGLLRFLRTARPPRELRTALAVIREFKGLENRDEWMIPFIAWMRLEQLEDYLRLLTGEEAEEVRDERAKAYLAAVRR